VRTNSGAILVNLRQAQSEQQRINLTEAMEVFTCRDKGVEYFLKEKAFEFEQRNFARTYLLLDAEEASNNNAVILAYFTLSIKALQFLPSVPKRKVKQIDGFSKNAVVVGAILIGQFGKDMEKGHIIAGDEIMAYAFESIYEVFETAACRIAFLESQPKEKLVEFYLAQGFEILQEAPNGLLQMVRFL
jgi:hypothetical protein